MQIIKIRSPYIVEVNEENQTAGKIELKIWKPNETKPDNPIYTLTKPIPAVNKTLITFNISPFVKDFIDNKVEEIGTETELTQYNYANVEVKRYFKIEDGEFTLVSTDDYIALNGFNNFMGGVNQYIDATEFANLSTIKEIYYNRGQMSKYYVQMYIPTADYKIVYKANSRKVELIPEIGINNIPLTLDRSYFEEGNTIEVVDTTATLVDCCSAKTYEIKAIPVCEPILTPVICSFFNRSGAIQQITFFKMRTDSIETTSDRYNFMPQNYNYDAIDGITRRKNLNGRQSIKLNTGFVNEAYNDAISDLLLSEYVLLDNIPVVVKTTGQELKTQIRNRNINFELEFEYAFDLINSVV